MDDATLAEAVEKSHLFAKLSPRQKTRVISSLQSNGHTVGLLGDGINDAPALRQADVGVSVDTAVDISKETADIVLLEKDLMVLERGVLEGRKTFGNIMKYIKMATSGNFGNIVSIMVASIFLPFLPILPVQLLTQNLLNDLAQIGMSFGNVDDEYLQTPKSWNAKGVNTFMNWLGPLSSIFDIICFLVLWFIMGANSMEKAPLFQAGWFLFGTLSQILIIHMIRTAKRPFIDSRPSRKLWFSTLIVGIIATIISFSHLAIGLGMVPLPLSFLPRLLAIPAGYMISVELVKNLYIKRYRQWI